MLVLVACEESQEVTKAFRLLGHEAYSCDILPCSGGHPEWHIQDDVMRVIRQFWDMIIMHPDCTAMSLSGNRWYAKGKPGYQKRIEAVEWTINLWNTAKFFSPKVALENPKSVIFPRLRKLGATVFYLQPYEHGHGETKETGFALHNLPVLLPSNKVDGREQRIWKMPPSPDRKKLRSKTYPGIAKAMAEQWGSTKVPLINE